MLSYMRNLYQTCCKRKEEKINDKILAMSFSERSEQLLKSANWEAASSRWIKALIENGADLEAKNEKGLTPLLIATLHHNMKVATQLISAGANVNAITPDGATPLMIAAARVMNFPRNVHEAVNEFQQIAEMLLRQGAHVNKQDALGRTALMYVGLNKDFPEAIIHRDRLGTANVGRGNMTSLLLRAAANPLKSDREGRDAWDYLSKDAMDRFESHDGIELLAKEMNLPSQYETFQKKFAKAKEEFEHASEVRRNQYDKESAEKRASLFAEYAKLRTEVIKNRLPIMNGPKEILDWPGDDDDFKKELFIMFKVVNEANLWNLFRVPREDLLSDKFDIIAYHPDVDACGHSGNTVVIALCVMKRIADIGWDDYCREVSEAAKDLRLCL